MRILLISTCKEKLHEREFVLPFVNYLNNKADVHVKHYSEVDSELDHDKIIICGTGIADNEYLNHLDKFSWIRNASQSIMGICSGSQIVAAAFGGKIAQNREIGMTDVKGNLFGREMFSAYSLHQNSIEDLDEFDILASSDKSVQAIKHKSKEIYGITFHPEVRNTWVLDEFLKL